jgi:hypothetical protein
MKLQVPRLPLRPTLAIVPGSRFSNLTDGFKPFPKIASAQNFCY